MEFTDISRGIYRNDSTCILEGDISFFFFAWFFLEDILEELKRESIFFIFNNFLSNYFLFNYWIIFI